MAVPYKRPIKKSPKSDPQQFKVYRMENEAIGARSYMSLTRKSVARFTRAVCRAYRLPRIQLRYKDLGKWGAEWMEPNIITLGVRTTSRDLLTIAHELAHHLHEQIAGDLAQESHGPEFMACYMSILDTCRIVPVIGMRAVCEDYGIRYLDPGTRSSLRRLRTVVRGSASGRAVQSLCLIKS